MAAPVPADPWSAGLMAAGSVASKALEKGTMQAANAAGASYDNSGWSVNVGSGAQSNQTDRSMSALGLGALLKNPLVLVVLAMVAYTVIARK